MSTPDTIPNLEAILAKVRKLRDLAARSTSVAEAATAAAFDVEAARMLAIEAMRVPTAGHSTDRGALITTILAACDTLDAWRTVTGADTPEALAAELDGYRARARPVRRPVRADDADLGGTADDPRTTP